MAASQFIIAQLDLFQEIQFDSTIEIVLKEFIPLTILEKKYMITSSNTKTGEIQHPFII